MRKQAKASKLDLLIASHENDIFNALWVLEQVDVGLKVSDYYQAYLP